MPLLYCRCVALRCGASRREASRGWNHRKHLRLGRQDEIFREPAAQTTQDRQPHAQNKRHPIRRDTLVCTAHGRLPPPSKGILRPHILPPSELQTTQPCGQECDKFSHLEIDVLGVWGNARLIRNSRLKPTHPSAGMARAAAELALRRADGTDFMGYQHPSPAKHQTACMGWYEKRM